MPLAERRLRARFAAALVALASAACSARTLAVRSMSDALARGDAVYGRDDDPELVREASSFGLKAIESLLEASPRHQGLLRAAASGFTQYAYAFVQQDGEELEASNLALAVAVLLDATLVRLAVGPALLCLAGRWNWWPGRRSGLDAAERAPLRSAG